MTLSASFEKSLSGLKSCPSAMVIFVCDGRIDVLYES